MVRKTKKSSETPKYATGAKGNKFRFDLLNAAQEIAHAAYKQHDVSFFIGPAGVGKTHLALAFAINDILGPQATKKKIILTRPIVESGENLGFLPGDMQEKVDPYMRPFQDCLESLVTDAEQVERIKAAMEVAPLAFQRGRAETLDSPIMTPTGIVPMGEIKVGDKVIGSNGQPINVVAVYPQGKKKIYKVSFLDKTYVKCSEDHLWSTMTLSEKRHNKGFSVKTTKEISENVFAANGQKNHKMPMLTGPVQFESQPITIDPYLLGVILGDGHIRKGKVFVSSADSEIVSECRNRVPAGISVKYKQKYDYTMVSEDKNNLLLKQLYKLDLVGIKSPDKFIPENYKFNSVEVRLELLRGLMDTDGWIGRNNGNKSCRIQFYTTSQTLADDIMFLVRSLGGYAYWGKKEFAESDGHMYEGHMIRHCHDLYQIDIKLNVNPFKLSRKANKYKNDQTITKLISSVEYIGEEECQCISVDSQDHLYVTNGFNITHNTFHDSVCILDEAQNATVKQMKLFLTRFGSNSKIIITGDPKQTDLKLYGAEVPLVEVVRKLENVQGISVVQFKAESIVRHPLVAAIIEKLDA